MSTVTATDRIPVLVTPAEKSRISARARAAGLSMGEFIRRAAEAFNPTEDDRLLEGMLDQMEKTTARASQAIDEALACVEASNQRIEALERRAEKRKAA
jgi:hypothetical protein